MGKQQFYLLGPPPPPKKNLDCGRRLRKGDCYLPGIHPSEGTSSCVYTFDKHRKSHRPEEDMWNLNVSLVNDYIKSFI